MSAQVTYLGHAGFLVESAGTTVLMDPWFHSAFLHSWFPYPDNSAIQPILAGRTFDYLYISHTHEDHFDTRFLETLDRSVTILAPNYRSRSMQKRFQALGFANILPLDHRQSHELAPGFTATMLLDTSHKEDSGLLLDMGGFRFLDLNDCNTPMSELPKDIDLLAAQFSGAMWYPNCYDYPPDVMQQKVDAVRRDLLDTLYRKIRIMQARAYIPSAGPPCFLDPALEAYNDRNTTIFPHWEDVEAAFTQACPETRVVRLRPNDRVCAGDDGLSIQCEPETPREDGLLAYRERRRADWERFYAIPDTPPTAQEVEQYFSTLQRRNKHFLRDFRKHVGLASGGSLWGIHLGKLAEDFVIEAEEPFDPEYTFVVSPRILRAIFAGETGWEEALLSMRIDLRRDPDVFDLTFMSLLRYGNEPVQTRQILREQQNTETIERDGLRMQRFCPHAGEDMAHAIICNGVVECPRHHWKWDVHTGECIEGGTLKLRVEVLDPAAPAIKPG